MSMPLTPIASVDDLRAIERLGPQRWMPFDQVMDALDDVARRHADRPALTALASADAAAPERIADFLRAKYQEPAQQAELPGAIAEVQRIFSQSIFVERKADWRVYPNNIGHKDWPGCFRCHDDKHKTADGQKVRASECSSCHPILAQGNGSQLDVLSAKGLEFNPPSGDLDPELTCADCHNGGIQK